MPKILIIANYPPSFAMLISADAQFSYEITDFKKIDRNVIYE